MQQSSFHNPIVIVLTEHPILGALLMPYITERSSENTISLTEQAFHASPKALATMTDVERKAIEIASFYTDKYLMSVYFKEQTLSKFLRKLADPKDKMKESMRPHIDKKMQEMVELIRGGELSFYQKHSGSKELYPHHAYHINKEPIETTFSFEVDEETFNYQLQCTHKGKSIALTEHKPVVVLTTNPATLLLGMEMFVFSHIEAARLLPFTKKARVSVPATFTQKYIDNIVIPIARYHAITTQGISMVEKKVACQPLLYIEDTIYSDRTLKLVFQYGNQVLAPGDSTDVKKIIHREDSEPERVIHYFSPNPIAEQNAIQQLIVAGLQMVGDSHFKLVETAPERSIPQWISNHREMLKDEFEIINEVQEKPYCLDEIVVEQSCQDGVDWFELHITVVIGSLRIPFGRFRKHILEEDREYTLPDGRIILLPQEWYSKYANLLKMGEEHEKTIRLKHSHVGIVQSILADDGHKEVVDYLPQQELPTPAGLKAELRPYQQKGFWWMAHLYQHRLGCCLADDMGLGKTLQTLTLLQYIYGNTQVQQTDSASISIVPEQPNLFDEKGQFELFNVHNDPSTLLPGNGKRDGEVATKHKPATLIVMPTSLLHNWRREAARFTSLSMLEYTGNNYISQNNLEQLFNQYHLIFTTYGIMRNNSHALSKYCFECVVLDESQNIKNSDSLTFRSAIQLRGHQRIVLTGTPIENSLKDLWSQFNFLQPGLLGEESEFNKQYINSIKQGDTRSDVRLRELIHPFILRRSKSEVAPELPPLTEEVIYCGMSQEQDTIYQQEKNGLRNVLLQISNNKEKHQPLTVLNGILRLRQLACHPQMVFADSFANSGKMELIINTFETLRSEGHKVLIFSSFVKHLELIADEFEKRSWSYALLTGATTKRPEEIAKFADTEKIQAFLISLKAGGVGLNLTQADYVFIIDPWWNPAAEAQAISRAHRMGQEKQVIAYRFITQDSIEEKIMTLQEEKRKLAAAFITNDESLPALTDKELAGLLE